MTLPPVHEILRKHRIRYVANAPDGFVSNCPECGQENTNDVELHDDVVGWHCRACNKGKIVPLRSARGAAASAADGKANAAAGAAKAQAAGAGKAGADDEARKLEEAKKESDDEPAAQGGAKVAGRGAGSGAPPPEEPGGPQPQPGPKAPLPDKVTLEDFVAYMPQHNYFFIPTREPWPAASVNARLPWMPLLDDNGNQVFDKKGKAILIPPSDWLDKNRPVAQVTWAPGEPLLIKDKLIAEGGWIERPRTTLLNLYRPPTLVRCRGDIKPWLDLAYRVYPDDADDIIVWLAHRVQRPHEKINHALVLGGAPGIGKDTMLEPAKRAVGHWNVREISPRDLFAGWTDFLRCVILRVSETHDLGEHDRFAFYDCMKTIIAAPPDVARVNEKHIRQYYIPNLCGVILTTNHKTDGIYLPALDRRHHVAWSDAKEQDFVTDDAEYWTKLWRWFDHGGAAAVAAYLAELDISSFDPKAPPPKTPAFWAIVSAGSAPEEGELADALEVLGNPQATTLDLVRAVATGELIAWLNDPKNRRTIPHRFEGVGYVPIRNDGADDGLWKINSKRQTVYANVTLTRRDQIAAARNLGGNAEEF